MRFKVEKARALIDRVYKTPDGVGKDEIASALEDACDEVEWHKARRTWHDTLSLMKHEWTAKCLDAYKKAFESLLCLVDNDADFRNGVEMSGVDEGAVRAGHFIADLKRDVFLAETRGWTTLPQSAVDPGVPVDRPTGLCGVCGQASNNCNHG